MNNSNCTGFKSGTSRNPIRTWYSYILNCINGLNFKIVKSRPSGGGSVFALTIGVFFVDNSFIFCVHYDNDFKIVRREDSVHTAKEAICIDIGSDLCILLLRKGVRCIAGARKNRNKSICVRHCSQYATHNKIQPPAYIWFTQRTKILSGEISFSCIRWTVDMTILRVQPQPFASCEIVKPQDILVTSHE